MKKEPVPDDINQYRAVISPPQAPLSVRIALYVGFGSGEYGIDNVRNNLLQSAGIIPETITSEDIETRGLQGYDVVIFPGGASKDESDALGEANRQRVISYVANGGKYLGICAGAYLALSGREWDLELLCGRVREGERHRGHGYPEVEIAPEGREIFGDVEGTFKCRYANGPIFEPFELPGLPAYTPVAHFRSDVNEYETGAPSMSGAPAAAWASYGKGRVFVVSPHPENTPGLEYFIPRILVWLTS